MFSSVPPSCGCHRLLCLTAFYQHSNLFVSFSAGKKTTNEEIETMLEAGNLQVFTQDVSSVFHLTPKHMRICIFDRKNRDPCSRIFFLADYD